MAEPDHDHVPGCSAVNFDPDTGRYTGTRAFDADRCPTCAAEKEGADAEPEHVVVHNVVVTQEAPREVHVHRWAWAMTVDNRSVQRCYDCGRVR